MIYLPSIYTQYRVNKNSMAGTERQRMLLLHPSQKNKTKTNKSE